MNIILYPPENPVFLNIFDIQIRYYGIIIAFALFSGILLCSYLIKKNISNKDYDNFLDIAPIVIIISVIGARLFYVLGSLDFYIKNPTEILFINHGGISIYGAILFGAMSIIISSKIKKFDFAKYSDIIALSLPLCQSIGRWGNFCNQEAYGIPYNGFLKMYIMPQYRYPDYINNEFYHPAFLYESILDIILFFILLFIFLKFQNIKKGTITSLYLIGYSLIRICVENIRTDSTLNISTIHCATILSALTLIIGFCALFIIYKHKS